MPKAEQLDLAKRAEAMAAQTMSDTKPAPMSNEERQQIELEERLRESVGGADPRLVEVARDILAAEAAKSPEAAKMVTEERASVARTDTQARGNAPIKGTPAGGVELPAKPAVEEVILVRTGRMRRPRRIVIYGPPGVGKTTLAADAETQPGADDVIFIDIDNGSEAMSVARYLFRPDDEHRGHVPRSLNEFLTGVRKLRDLKVKGKTKYRTVVIDQLDRLEFLVQRHVMRRDAASEGKDMHGLESYGYGKGKQVLLDEMRIVLAEIDGLISAGFSVIILAHSTTEKFSNPSGADFDRYGLKCNKLVAGYVYEWADEVGFLHFEDRTVKLEKRGKSKGESTGRRLLEFDRSAAWDAKARLPLPRNIAIGTEEPWGFMRSAIERAYAMTPDELRSEIAEELIRIGDDKLTVRVGKALQAAGNNVDRLTKGLQDLRRTPEKEAEPEEKPLAPSDDI